MKIILIILLSFIFLSCSSVPKKTDFKSLDGFLEYLIDDMSAEKRERTMLMPKEMCVKEYKRYIESEYLDENNNGIAHLYVIRTKQSIPSLSAVAEYFAEELWLKMHKEYGTINFSAIEPSNYFAAVWEQIEKGRDDDIYFSSLPDWLYFGRDGMLDFELRPRSYYYAHDYFKESGFAYNSTLSFTMDGNFLKGNIEFIDEVIEFEDKIEIEAEKLASGDSQLAPFALLWLANKGRNREKIEDLIESFLSQDDKFINLPSINVSSLEHFQFYAKYLLFEPKELSETVEYDLHHLSYQDLGILCYGLINNRRFKTVEEVRQWPQVIKDNYLLSMEYRTRLKCEDMKTLIDEPRRFLEFLFLSKKYFHPCPMTIRSMICNFRENIIFTIQECFQIEERRPDGRHGRSTIGGYKEILDYFDNKITSYITNKLSMEDLLDMISPATIKNYEKNIQMGQLEDYEYLAFLLLENQKNRLFQYHNREKVFECYAFYWKHKTEKIFRSGHTAKLLFELNPKKALKLFFEYFNDFYDEASYKGVHILNLLIEKDFEANKQFIEKRFWMIKKNDDYSIYNKRNMVLNTLEYTGDATRKLLDIIKNDPRY